MTENTFNPTNNPRYIHMNHDCAEGVILFRGFASSANLQVFYEQAATELFVFGQPEARFYCRRVNGYVSEEEIAHVSALEWILGALEDKDSPAAVLAMLDAVHPYADKDTIARFANLIRATL